MRLLLDEHLDWRLTRAFSDAHEVRSVRGMGWTAKKNGDLLRSASAEFDALLTLDRNMEHQQALNRYDLTILLLRAPSNRLPDTLPFVPAVERQLSIGVEPGRLYVIAA